MSETVLVTGVTGYVAGWCIVELLQRGYEVRTTVLQGVVAASSLVIGALVAFWVRLSQRWIALILAFDLAEEATAAASGSGWAILGLFAGCFGFFGDRARHRLPRRRVKKEPSALEADRHCRHLLTLVPRRLRPVPDCTPGCPRIRSRLRRRRDPRAQLGATLGRRFGSFVRKFADEKAHGWELTS